MNNTYETVGLRILNLLIAKKMTQQDLAVDLNMSKQVLNKIIRGKKAINVSEVSRIADALEVPIDSILSASGQTDAEPCFNFMGNIQNPKTRDKVLLLKEVIDEIILLEDYADEFVKRREKA